MNTIASTDLLLHDIPEDVQKRATAAAKRGGITLSDLMRRFLDHFARNGQAPFYPYAPSGYEDEVPNEETLEAMRELEREMDDLPSYGSAKELMDAFEREEAARTC